MKVSDFDYELPEELIAQTPILKRDESRLMVLSRENKTCASYFLSKLQPRLGV